MKRPTKAAREQLSILYDAGAFTAVTGKSIHDVPTLNPMTIGSLRRRKLADSTEVKTSQRKYTIYWLTPLGKVAVETERPATRKAKASGRADDIVFKRIKQKDKITAPGFYRMSSATYHADPCPAPAISTGIADELVQKSPRHAWIKSPRCPLPGAADALLTPSYQMDIGSAVHAFAFGDAKTDVVWIEGDNWKDNRKRGFRDVARREGKVAILTVDRERVIRMAEILQPVIEHELGCALGDAYGEVVIASNEGPKRWRRTRCDLLRGDCKVVLDVKTTAALAEPEATKTRLFDQGAHIQEALTHHILDALDPANIGRRVMRFISIEQLEPHATSVIEFDAAARDAAAQQLAYALTAWDHGVEKDEWPAYGDGVHSASMPNWMLQRWRLRAITLGIADENGELR